jgi:hypothetical protein
LAVSFNSGLDDDETKFVLFNIYDTYTPEGVFTDFEYPQDFVQENLKGRLAAEAYRDKTGDGWNYKLHSYDHLGKIKEQRVYE